MMKIIHRDRENKTLPEVLYVSSESDGRIKAKFNDETTQFFSGGVVEIYGDNGKLRRSIDLRPKKPAAKKASRKRASKKK